jgi:hypothetical protein
MASTEPVAKRTKLAFLVHDLCRCLLPTECKNERGNLGQCGDITPLSHGLPPTRFGNSSDKAVHQIWEPGNANVPGGLLDLHVTWCTF